MWFDVEAAWFVVGCGRARASDLVARSLVRPDILPASPGRPHRSWTTHPRQPSTPWHGSRHNGHQDRRLGRRQEIFPVVWNCDGHTHVAPSAWRTPASQANSIEHPARIRTLTPWSDQSSAAIVRIAVYRSMSLRVRQANGQADLAATMAFRLQMHRAGRVDASRLKPLQRLWVGGYHRSGSGLGSLCDGSTRASSASLSPQSEPVDPRL